MKLSDILPIAGQLKLVEGVERVLLRRRQTGMIGGVAAIAWAVIQIVISVFNANYLKNIDQFVINLVSGQWGELIGAEGLSITEFTGILFLIITVAVYLVFRWTSFLLKEAKEPFRYSFLIESFKQVTGTPGANFTLKRDDRLHLLHHDLTERLNQRIQRFSLLDVDPLKLPPPALTSHIQISGHYAIREEKPGNWVMHVMPRVRIGPLNRPAAVASPVKFPLTAKEVPKSRDGSPSGANHIPAKVFEDTLDADQYNQLVEMVYSSIATEVYRQVKSDVKGKIALFPSNYLRAVALFYEAKDFERSNTIDSYDCAIELYNEAKRYFDIANIKWISRCLMRMRVPILWRKEKKFLYMDARTRIGYSRSMIYRRIISALSGRSKNPLFEICKELDIAIEYLMLLYNRINKQWKSVASKEDAGHLSKQERAKSRERLYSLIAFLTFPKDSALRRSKPLFDKIRESLFDAHVVAALAYYYLGAIQKAKDCHNNAKAVAPDLSVEDPLYLLAAAEIEPDLDKEILLFQQAADRAPNFEIAQYRLAYYSEMRFRAQNEITKARAESVLKEYEEVHRINPGNIASLAAQGYLLWLLENFNEAKKRLEEGCGIKAIIRQTFIGELSYGLARIAAAEGRFNKSYDLYIQAISADPGVGACSTTAGSFVTTSYYDYIDSAMLKRYWTYKDRVLNRIEKFESKIKSSRKSANGKKIRDKEKKEISLNTLNVIQGFVLNDYGNACLNYFLRFGDYEQLGNAIDDFEKAIERNPDNVVAHYNLHNAYVWRGEQRNTISKCLEKAEKLAPAWPVVLIASAQHHLRSGQVGIMNLMEEAEKEFEQAECARNKSKALEDDSQKALEKGRLSVSQPDSDSKMAGTAIDGRDWLYDEARSPLLRLSEEQEKVQKHMNKAKDLFESAEKKLEKYIQPTLREIREIIERTKLSSVYEGLGFKPDGRGVNELLSEEIEADRLDENDLEALRVWVEVLSNNYQNEKAVHAAENLSEYIVKQYYPENFDVNRILLEMYQRMKRFYFLSSKLRESGNQKEEYDEKIEDYTNKIQPIIKNWLDQDPVHYTALLYASIFFEGKNRIILFDRAIENGPEVAVYYSNLGNILRSKREWQEAEKAFTKAIEIEPNNAKYQNMIGKIYFDSGAYEKSINPYKKAIKIKPKVGAYHANLGGSYRALGKWQEAEKAYRSAIELEPDNAEYQNMLGNVYFGRGDFEKSIEPYKKAIDFDPTVAVYHANLGGSYRALGKWQEAEKAYSDAVAIEPDKASYQNMLGVVYYKNRNYEKAIDSYKKAIEKDSKVFMYHANLVLAYSESGRQEDAENAFQEAIAIEPDNPVYQNDLGNAFFGNGDYQKAIACYKQAIEKSPGVAVYHANMGRSFRALGKWQEAEKAYRSAIELEPDNAEYQNMLGNVYFGRGDFEKSIEPYKKAIDFDPTVAVYHANLGGSYRALGKWQEAEKAYSDAVAIEPDKASYQNMLGVVYYKNRNYEKTIDSYKKAIKVAPEMAVYHANLGLVFSDLGKWEEAEKAYHAAIELEPDNAEYQNILGIAYYKNRNYEKAIDSYKKAIEKDPKMVMYHANLVLACSELGKQEDAENAFQEAIAIEPGNPVYQNDLGDAFFVNGDYQRAADQYLNALKINPEAEVNIANLILACEQLEDLSKAEFLLRLASKLIPNNIQITQAIEKLKNR